MKNKYYTLFLGDEPWENIIDDMCSGDIWAYGGMFWREKEKAEACMERLKKPVYGFEEEGKKFSVVEFFISPPNIE